MSHASRVREQRAAPCGRGRKPEGERSTSNVALAGVGPA